MRVTYCRWLSFGLSLAAFAVAAASARAQTPSFTLIARSSDPAPGSPYNFAAFANALPNILPSGQVAFNSRLNGPNPDGDFGIWVGTAGALQLVLRTGDPAPGTPAGVVIPGNPFYGESLNSSGQVAFVSFLTGTGLTSANDLAVYVGAPGGVQLAARTGSAAPGTAAGVVFAARGLSPGTYVTNAGATLLNDAGQVAFRGNLSGPGVTFSNDQGIWVGAAGGIQLAARTGSAAPGTAVGVSFSFVDAPTGLSGSGQVVFTGFVSGTGVTGANNSGIWAGAPGAVQLAARAGSAAPGTGAGVTYAPNTFVRPVINASGQVAFFSSLTGTGVSTSNDQGIWVGTPGAFQLAARKGDQAPGMVAGLTYAGFDPPVLNATGQVAFRSFLGGGSGSDDRGIFAGAPGAVQLYARVGDAAPGLPVGLTFATVGNPGLNAAGQIAFFAELAGPGVTPNNDHGIWAGGPGGLHLIARTGDIIDVDPGIGVTLETIRNFGSFQPGGNLDTGYYGLSDNGLVSWSATFVPANIPNYVFNAVFVTAITPVPEPSHVLFACGCLAAGCAQWSRLRRQLIGERCP